MSDHDTSDDVFRDYRKSGGPDPGPHEIDDSVFAHLPQIEEPASPDIDDELILGLENVTYLLFAANRALGDFQVSTDERELQVKTTEFTVKKALAVRVDPAETRATYHNGVFCIKMRRWKKE